MARSDLLMGLFAAYSRGDDRGFRVAAYEIIADERRKQHQLLATELEHALTRDLRPGAADPLTLRPVPKSRDERPLLRLGKAEWELRDLVLSSPTMEIVSEVIAENRSRSILAGHGLRPRQHLLFIGPPGTGKTATAHAIAAELSLPVAIVSTAAITSSYLGETARNVESVVRFAESSPCVLIFDEIDALVGERARPQDHAEMRRVVATILQLFEEVHGESVLIATSNHPSLIDSALWRRFDEVVGMSLLDEAKVAALLDLRTRSARRSLALAKWGARLKDFPPAEIEAICLAALRRLALSDAPRLTDEIFVAAFDAWQRRQASINALSGDV
jgi:ATP-dependent 26S proteasome regulatory subunit